MMSEGDRKSFSKLVKAFKFVGLFVRLYPAGLKDFKESFNISLKLSLYAPCQKKKKKRPQRLAKNF